MEGKLTWSRRVCGDTTRTSSTPSDILSLMKSLPQLDHDPNSPSVVDDPPSLRLLRLHQSRGVFSAQNRGRDVDAHDR